MSGVGRYLIGLCRGLRALDDDLAYELWIQSGLSAEHPVRSLSGSKIKLRSIAAPEMSPKLAQQLRFLIQVLRERSVGALGFWPWSTLYDRGGALPAAVYAAIRRMQG